MPAYAIVRTVVTDPVQYEEYKKLSRGAVAAFGGEFLVRGGETLTVEGSTDDRRMVVLRFPDVEAATACFASDQYAEARAQRLGAAEMEILIVEGV